MQSLIIQLEIVLINFYKLTASLNISIYL